MHASTDYLVVGSGASGLAFVDALVAETDDVEVTMVDRRTTVGGHWVDAYPFVRLHIPSAYYGVNSLALGDDRIDEDGENAGFYERATGEAVRAHFDEAAARLTATGRVRYLEASIPATHTPSFEISPAARVVPVNDLPAVAGSASSYTVLGSGKTAVDGCMWLLDNGVAPDRIRWVRPREAWFHDRVAFQPLEQVGGIIEGISLDAEAAAQASDVDDLFDRLEETGRVARIDPTQPATMYRGTMLSARELHALRQIEDVVRLGRVRRIEGDRIVLDRGEVATAPEVLHVDCTAVGLREAPATPIFQPGRIVLQQVRQNSPCFNCALAGFLEARRDDDGEKNRLCPPNPFPRSVVDWPRLMGVTWTAEYRWLKDPEVASWVAGSRLNLLRALPDHAGEPEVQTSLKRYLTNVGPAIERLKQLDAQPVA